MDVDFADAIRPFAQFGDLDLDLDHDDRPALITALLSRCSQKRDAPFWWRQPVGRRLRALLVLLRITEGNGTMNLSASCTEADCAQTFGFELPLDALPAGGDVPPSSIEVRVEDDRRLAVRLPTGDDLRQWRAARPASREQAVRLMLDTLLLDGELRPADEAAVSAAIASHDPLVDFSVSCTCPACGAANFVQIDLEQLAVRRLAHYQRRLLLEVHRLASHYGWTERQVLAVPARRRAQYLALIENGE